jgi:serine/threonine-protein kinase
MIPQSIAYLDTMAALDETIVPQPLRGFGGEEDASRATSPPSVAATLAESEALSTQSGLQIQSLIATGGMGRVLLAKQPSLQRDVAVKTVRPDMMSPTLSVALLEEGQITGSLEHPNIIPVHSLGATDEGGPFLVMKRVDGVSWGELISDAKSAGWARVRVHDGDKLAAHLQILTAVCSATEFAHKHGVLHRDIKPDNVMVGEYGEVYLVDWGVATALDPTDPRYRKDKLKLVGTPGYMAPEMIADDGGPVDARTDLYLLGGTLHTALTGEARHQASSMMAMLYQSTMSVPVSYGPDVPAELAEIANRACHRLPEERFASAAALRDAVVDFLRHRASSRLSDGAWTRLDRWMAQKSVADTPDARARVRQQLLECKFGFAHALESWSENTRARDGLRACALLALREDIARGNLVGAEEQLLEVERPPSDVMDALEALRSEVHEREARASRHLERDRQEDWTHSAGLRAAFFATVAVFSTGLWLWTNDGQILYRGTLSPRRLATTVGVMLGINCVITVVLRKRLLATRVNAQLVYGALIVVAGMFANRVANCWPVQYSATLVSTELVFCAVGAALGGLTVAPWLWWQVPLWLTGAFAVRALPSFAGAVFIVTALLSLIVGVWRLRIVVRERAASGRPSSLPTQRESSGFESAERTSKRG